MSRIRKEKIDCFRCRYFYVTWDEKFPRGCRAMNFKTKKLPADAVFEASGMKCLKYEEKKK